MDETTEKLTKIFQIINDWLKFAEAKNAVLLTFSSAGITSVITYLSAASNPPNSLKIGLILTASFLCISSLICSISFLPKTSIEYVLWLQSKPSKASAKNLKDTDNLYFFGDLKKYTALELLNTMNNAYFTPPITQPYKKEYLDIANQIVINSQITMLKFQFFIKAVWSLIISIIIIPLTLLFSLIIYRHI